MESRVRVTTLREERFAREECKGYRQWITQGRRQHSSKTFILLVILFMMSIFILPTFTDYTLGMSGRPQNLTIFYMEFSKQKDV